MRTARQWTEIAFADLDRRIENVVRCAVDEAVAAEREACAAVADSMPDGLWQHGVKIAAAIRARKP